MSLRLSKDTYGSHNRRKVVFWGVLRLTDSMESGAAIEPRLCPLRALDVASGKLENECAAIASERRVLRVILLCFVAKVFEMIVPQPLVDR
jgi:hypothetical protein